MRERGEISSFDINKSESGRESRVETRALGLKDQLREFLASLRESGIYSADVPELTRSEDAEAENIIETMSSSEPEQTSLLKKFRSLPPVFRKGLLALAFASEVAAAQSVFGESRQKQEYKSMRSEVRPRPPTELRLGRNHVMIENDETGIFVKHNFRRPESLAEAGKMFLEPLSFGMKFTVGRDAWAAKVLTGSSKGEDFVFSADIPYEYARDFEKASPADRKKMEEEMEQKARGLVEKILPSIIGVSFFKDEVKNIAARNAGKIKEVTIDGFASGETDTGIDRNDARNQRLSELRAENAAYVLKKVMKENGIEAGEIRYQGKGEQHLAKDERAELLRDAASLKIGPNGLPEDIKLVELIKRYNDGKITRQDIKEHLDRYVGQKRKVAVTIETDERKFVLVLPLPLLLPLLARLIPDRTGSSSALYAHFLESPPGNENLGEEDRIRGRRAGRNLRRGHLLTDPVRPLRDAVKGYSGSGNPAPEYRDEIAAGARHWRKRTPRERINLDFDPNLPLAQRAQALGFVIDRYGRMAASLTGRRRGESRRRSFDLVNVYRDREAMQSLLRAIAREHTPQGFRHVPNLILNENVSVQFEFRATAPWPGHGGIGHRRERIFGAVVIVDNQRYGISSQDLATIADHYLAGQQRE